MSNRLRATKVAGDNARQADVAGWFLLKLSVARATSVSLPSMPSTSRALLASGRVKLPRPQNQSITRSSDCTSSRRSALPTSARLMCGLTCVKSVGLKGIVTPNSGNRYASGVPPSSSSFTVSGPLACSHHWTPSLPAAKAFNRSMSARESGSR